MVGTAQISPHTDGEPEFEPASMPFRQGDIIGEKYEVLHLLSSDGMAFVVAAKHLELDEKVALKFLRSECLVNKDLVDRFTREARASVKIQSEHVARVFDVGTLPDGAPFIVMEYLDGKDLGAVLREEEVLPLERVAEYLMQACEALAAAHAIGIVHRDIKPENLFLTRVAQGLDVIKVLEFNTSQLALTGPLIDRSGPLTTIMRWVETPIYMSPEEIRGTGNADGRADIWSLGCVLYEVLTGHLPFEAPSIATLTAAILEQPAPLLGERRSDLPEQLEAVLARCLEKSPERRFQDVGELAAALCPFAPARAYLSVERCNQILRKVDPSGVAATPPPTSPTRRRSKKSMVAAFCILLVAGGITLWLSDVTPLFARAASIATTALEGMPLPTETAYAPTTADSVTTPTFFESEAETAVVTEAPNPTTLVPSATADSTEPPDPIEVGAPAASAPNMATVPIPSARRAFSPLRKSRPLSKPHSPTSSPTDVDVGF